MIVVLDTNCFHSDRGVSRPQLTELLGHAEQGRCSVVVPESVIAELINQYPSALKSAIDKTRAALGGLRAVDIVADEFVSPDTQKLVAAYEATLRQRLSRPGCRIATNPGDVGALVDRSVRELKPFGTKKADNSVVDAVIWFTVLDLVDDDEVVLVSENINDFCEEGTLELHSHLKYDLTAKTHGARLVKYVQDLVDELAPSETEKAQALLEQPQVFAEVERRLYDALINESIDRDLHQLSVSLDNDPTIDGLDVLWLEPVSFVERGDSRTVEFNAYCSAQLELFIYKPDFWGVNDPDGFWPSDLDFNESYVLAGSEVELRVRCLVGVNASDEVEDLEVIVVETVLGANAFAERLSNQEQVELMNEIAKVADAAAVKVDGYLPPQAISSEIESAVISSLHATSFEVISAQYVAPETWRVRTKVRSDTSVEWRVTGPNAADAETFAALDVSDDDAAPVLQDVEDFAPIGVIVELSYRPADGWSDPRISAYLSEDAARERIERRKQ